jgi:hypothetical protein
METLCKKAETMSRFRRLLGYKLLLIGMKFLNLSLTVLGWDQVSVTIENTEEIIEPRYRVGDGPWIYP